MKVLNLIINGIPSILSSGTDSPSDDSECFKPYYKWNTFNTHSSIVLVDYDDNGFKPYYKWNTFNTMEMMFGVESTVKDSVLNLIINGIPSIHLERKIQNVHV